jgi:hypothetical protein
VTEGEERLHHKPKLEFGQPLWKRQHQGELFPEGDDLPLFSGTPQPVIDRPFVPEPQEYRQTTIPDMPPIDYDRVREKDRALRNRRRKKTPTVSGTNEIFP